MNETRVNLKHLLEDIRDSYTAPLEEVIVTELVANALDSKASSITFTIDPAAGFFRCIDNGRGMKRSQLKEYHNIAATTKQRGEGIGFAGVGAKLALLLAERVVTESKGGYGTRAATEWRLTNPYRAPWKFVPSTDIVPSTRGTAVTLYFGDQQTHLLRADFVRQTITKHFYPLFHERLQNAILRFVYKKGIEFVVNGEVLLLDNHEQRADHFFTVSVGKSRSLAGAGFLVKRVLEQSWVQKITGQELRESILPSGISVATYGKIIKSGWEWLGILPRHHALLSGVVEIPALSALLTTNKNDFLSDAVHLKQYYKFRKAIQQAILPLLKELGEYAESERQPIDKNMKTITKQIENALVHVTDDFPELLPLLGSRRKVEKRTADLAVSQQSLRAETVNEQKKRQQKPGGESAKREKGETGFKKAGLTIVLEELRDEPEALGRMVDDVVYVNTIHPAWRRALKGNMEEYHIVVTVGLVLSEFLDPTKHPQAFLEKLLSAWGEGGESRERLF